MIFPIAFYEKQYYNIYKFRVELLALSARRTGSCLQDENALHCG